MVAATALVRKAALESLRNPVHVELNPATGVNAERLHHVPPLRAVGTHPAITMQYMYDVVRDLVGHSYRQVFLEILREQVGIVADHLSSAIRPVHPCGTPEKVELHYRHGDSPPGEYSGTLYPFTGSAQHALPGSCVDRLDDCHHRWLEH